MQGTYPKGVMPLHCTSFSCIIESGYFDYGQTNVYILYKNIKITLRSLVQNGSLKL